MFDKSTYTFTFTAHEVDPEHRFEATQNGPTRQITVKIARMWQITVLIEGCLFPLLISTDTIILVGPREKVAEEAAREALQDFVPVFPFPHIYQPYEEFSQKVLDILEMVDQPHEMLQAIYRLPGELPSYYLERRNITSPFDRTQFEKDWRGFAFTFTTAMRELLDRAYDNTFRYGRIHESLRKVYKYIPREAQPGEAQTIYS